MVYLTNTHEMLKLILEKIDKIEAVLSEHQKQPLTLNEASEFLKISKSYLYKMTCQNKLPYYQPNGK